MVRRILMAQQYSYGLTRIYRNSELRMRCNAAFLLIQESSICFHFFHREQTNGSTFAPHQSMCRMCRCLTVCVWVNIIRATHTPVRCVCLLAIKFAKHKSKIMFAWESRNQYPRVTIRTLYKHKKTSTTGINKALDRTKTTIVCKNGVLVFRRHRKMHRIRWPYTMSQYLFFLLIVFLSLSLLMVLFFSLWSSRYGQTISST